MPQVVQGKKQLGNANLLIYLAGAVIIIVILLFVFGRGGGQPTPTSAPTPIDSQVQQLEQQSNSDEISAINADLQNTNLDKIDQELTDVEQSLQSL